MNLSSQQLQLIDPHGRRIHKLRVQLTDACNFRCFYCMPEKVKFTPPLELLTPLEFKAICSNLVELGIDEIRVSGGEPLVRSDFDEIIERLSRLPLCRLGLTTNGYFLQEKLAFLKQTSCRHINISLDSLREERFKAITKTSHFRTVYESAIKAKVMGFPIKINVVVLKGINDDEIFDFIKFSAQYQIEVRFLELIKIGPYYKTHSNFFISAQEMITTIEEKEKLYPQSVNSDSTSFNFLTESGGRIGFIASESQPFCGFCSRWRLTATGKLRACLMSEAGVNLRGVSKSEYPLLLKSALKMKPIERLPSLKQPMYQIGG